MAIFYFNAKAISRSSGSNACKSAAYNARTQITDEKAGKTYDYSDRTDLAYSLIMTPEVEGRAFEIDRSTLWNLVEATEQRSDSQLARSIVLALPTEIDDRAKWMLTKEFVRDNFTSKGTIADVNVHDIQGNNPHVHILLTMRNIKEISPSGEIVFGLKNRTWNDKKLLEEHKKSWANLSNRYLELADRPERIDHRSYEERGIDRIPQIHIGEAAWNMEKRGIKTERGDLHRQIAAANQEIERLQSQSVEIGQSIEVELREEIERREREKRSEPGANPWKEISTKEQQAAHQRMLDRQDRRGFGNLQIPRSDRDRPKQAPQKSYSPAADRVYQAQNQEQNNRSSDDRELIKSQERDLKNDLEHQTPLDRRIESLDEILAQNGNNTDLEFDIHKTVLDLFIVADKDPVHQLAIKELNKQLIRESIDRGTSKGNLSELVENLKAIRNNPQSFIQQDITQEEVIDLQIEELTVRVPIRGGGIIVPTSKEDLDQDLDLDDDYGYSR